MVLAGGSKSCSSISANEDWAGTASAMYIPISNRKMAREHISVGVEQRWPGCASRDS